MPRFTLPVSRSMIWTGLLIPFLLLPYRYLWFPCGLAAMLVVLPGRWSWRDLLRRDGTLVVGSMLVLLVRTGLDPGWWVPWLAVMSGLGVWWMRFGPGWRSSMCAMPVVWILAVGFLLRPGWPRFSSPQVGLGAGAVLVCAGDSLTSGLKPGSDAETYVAYLRTMLPGPVINAGVANDKTGDLLKRLDRDVLSHEPATVLLFIGGNDYLDGTPRGLFRERLDAVAGRIVSAGCRLVIVEVPSGIIWNRYAGVYRHVARRHGASLVPESRLRLWYSVELLARDRLPEPLTLDGIHLSPAGARRVADWLEPHVRVRPGAACITRRGKLAELWNRALDRRSPVS